MSGKCSATDVESAAYINCKTKIPTRSFTHESPANSSISKGAAVEDYKNRFERVPDCMDVSTMTSDQMKWLPASCAYRLRAEDKALPLWHPLITGHVSSVKKDPRGIRGKVISETKVKPEDLEDYIIRWIDA